MVSDAETESIFMEPIHRQPLALQVASRIRDLIATDQFPPGTPLKEMNLCKQLSVSRTPLREALKQLIAEGLVEQIPYRGLVVCNPDQASIEQMLESFLPMPEVLYIEIATHMTGCQGTAQLLIDIRSAETKARIPDARMGREPRKQRLLYGFENFSTTTDHCRSISQKKGNIRSQHLCIR